MIIFVSLFSSLFLLITPLSGAMPDNRPLLQAVVDGDISEVKRALKNEALIDEIDYDGNGALHLECQTADVQTDRDILWVLLENFSDVRMRNTDNGEIPLHHTLYISDIERRMGFFSDLIKNGSDINARNNQGETVLDKAVRMREQDGVEAIMSYWGCLLTPDTIERAKKKAGSQAGDGFGFTEVYEALNQKITAFDKVDGTDPKNGMTALMLQVLRDDKKKVLDLISRGARLEERTQDRWGYTALDVAILAQNVALVELLLEKGAHINSIDKTGRSVLQKIEAIRNESKRLRIAHLLLAKKVDINFQDKDGYTIVHDAIRLRDVKLLDLLVNEYATQINKTLKDNYGRTIFDLADIIKNQEINDILSPLKKDIRTGF